MHVLWLGILKAAQAEVSAVRMGFRSAAFSHSRLFFSPACEMFLCRNLELDLLLLLLVVVSASLPPPCDVQMIAVNLDYILRWDWNYTHLKIPVTFTVDSDAEEDERLYKQACEGTTERWCDFTHCRLPFSASFLVRVRAEAGLQHSNWTVLNFTPDIDGKLAPPGPVKATADKDMLMLMIPQSVMSDVMKDLQYRVQYWEKFNPNQKGTEVYGSPHAPLRALKSGTEYCVQVSIFSLEYNKSSNYTSPLCIYTKDRSLAWVAIPAVLCGVVLSVVLLYIGHKFRRKSEEYPTPEIFLEFSSAPLLLEAQEECFTIAQVIMPAIQPAHTPPEEEQEEENVPDLQAPDFMCHCKNNSVQDSGFSSGLES
ncbi:interferon alpha/beta receptor 1a-like isoform X2 [Silurus meridionalis]|uniref:interferon alpha/beta receptor 1a-like isoform X2 n=1 Tax=Silurus meridionalis TaxID=175797 RepID=UPI001EECACE9|nr:interferon alpha/beta receptor 1a-like isoform X2 [Silurus meridionalis]